MKKYGWTEKGIVGMIFAPLGLVFLIVGALVTRLGAVEPNERLAFLICFVGVGAVFFLVGLILLGLELNRRARQRAAFEGGRYVMGRIVGSRIHTQVNLFGTHPVSYEVHYADPDTGVVHVYFSRYLYINADDLLASDEVPVYIDRSDSQVGFVDIDAVLPKVEVHR